MYSLARLVESYSRISPPSRPSRYSLPSRRRITSAMCLGIRLIQAWILFWDKFFQHLIQARSASIRVLRASFLIVSRFIQGQQGLIILRSSEFPHHSKRIMLRDKKIDSWYLKACVEALSFIIVVLSRDSLHFWVNLRSLGISTCF